MGKATEKNCRAAAYEACMLGGHTLPSTSLQAGQHNLCLYTWDSFIPHAAQPLTSSALSMPDCRLCAMQAVRAAAEAQQVPSDTELGSLPSRVAAKPSKAKPMGLNPMGPKKLPAASKPSNAKPVIIRKRAQPPADADAQQVGAASAKSSRCHSGLIFTFI